ncbi:putative fungal-specific transcription protein [Favolaschia claudopus]|uniref:Fungal-specific transcription protein n=1 Tax=Favolaschia claudopus TaxID=2862362 RepID=A0AAW0BU10_9AGAR
MASQSASNPNVADSFDPQPAVQSERLLLTESGESGAPSGESIPKLQPGGPAVKLDDLGPLVVNSDGTLSRIANWSTLTEAERANTIRVLSKRNKIRLANEEQKLQTGVADAS